MTFKGPQVVVSSGDMSDDITSLVTITQQLVMASYSIVWTGSSPIGTISIEASNDYSENADGTVRNSGTWFTLPLSASTDVSGNSDKGFIDIDAHAGFALRLKYTSTSGTGAMQVIMFGK